MAYVAITVLLLGCGRYFKQQDLLSAGQSAIRGVTLLRSLWYGVGNYDGAVGGCGS